ncbi:TetR/AcrR family transcriptional regulator [Actinoplanes ianthinogenes]|uniref:TetR/AcrR family transcriptional regulator n=1 Tax=Actinoplanes ianthinogenes TaxID=122358 RepID=UPI00166FA6CE|nr:TetR/AcrR family transcriptional regulator [Actinoplanes ianthinogenes]
MTASRPGGRTARTAEAVTAALTAELLEVGYAGTSIDRIARRAGVAKTTVYRRWGTVGQLVVDVFAGIAGQQVPVPDTGSLEGDLRELARSTITMLREPESRAVFDIVVGEAIHDPAARAALDTFFAARISNAAVMVERAVARGEAPAETDPAEVIRQVGSTWYARMYITGEPITLADADRAAAVTALATRAGLLT